MANFNLTIVSKSQRLLISRHFCQFWVPFPANPSQIPPTLCHGNKVKPWKSLENYQIYRSFDETEKERKKKAVFGRNSQKFTKSAKKNRKKVFQPKMLKFYRGRWTPWSNAPVWAPTSHALADLAKKCQMRKFPKKNFFSKFQKRSKKVEKMIAEWTEAVSEGGNRGKVAKKEK